MRRLTIVFLAMLFNLLFLQQLVAEVQLPAILSSNMVLQRNSTVKLWGWADAGEKITITTSWLDKNMEVEADKSGNWQLALETTNSKAPQKIQIRDASSNLELDNILFGEVWLCSGQSNMQQPINGYNGQPTFGTNKAVANSRNSDLRLFTVERNSSKTPLKDVEKYQKWAEASPANVPGFSAVAYYFGQQLQEILDCPVGMIHSSWGGSKVEAWISDDVLRNFIEYDLDSRDLSDRPNQTPTLLYNAMIHPLIPFSIKGALWYQGEANRLEPEAYKELFPAMVKDWRTRWDLGDFPFYYAQIAPYLYGNNDVFQEVDNTAFIREAQLACLDLIPNSGIAITMDIGEAYCIHPAKKKEVADRLLYNALNQTYGLKTIDYASPVYDSFEAVDGGMLLKFKNAEKGLYAYDNLTGFEIAGEDKVFYPATAKIIKRMDLFVESEKVPNPVAVRYAWKNWIVGTLYDTYLLPASSFRTDNWEEATRAED